MLLEISEEITPEKMKRQSHIHNWVLFLLWLCLFILPPLISSSILGTYRPGEFISQCPIFFFHTVHGVLKVIILKWFAIPFSRRRRETKLKNKQLHILSELSIMTTAIPNQIRTKTSLTLGLRSLQISAIFSIF